MIQELKDSRVSVFAADNMRFPPCLVFNAMLQALCAKRFFLALGPSNPSLFWHFA
jgi:hypothetical protein